MIRNRGSIIALLTALNFVNYLDRTIVAAVLPRIQADLGLSNFEGGLLATIFLIGYFATAPIFGAKADRGPRKGLIAFGVATWSVATIASGLASTLPLMLLARAVVGVGEASYASLAPTIIDDLTPPERKGRTLAVFFLAMPLGSALGYLLGGFVEKRWGWHAAFFVGGGPGLLLAASCLLIDEPRRRLAKAAARPFDSLRVLTRIPLYRRTVIGYCAQTAAIGAFGYWAPKFLDARFHDQGLDLAKANFWFGLVTVAAGLIGTAIGGAWADRARLPADTAAHDARDNRVALNHLLRICAVGVAFAAPIAFAAFLMPGPVPFFVLGFFVELGVFLATSPVNAILLRAVPVELRAGAMALAIFSIHIFGDLWSPPGIGLIADYLPMVTAMMGLPVLLAIAAAIWWPRAHEAQ